MALAPGLLAAAVAAVALAAQALLIRVGTDGGRASDAVVVGLLVNVVVLLPVTAAVHYPAVGLTLRSVGAFVAAGLVGSLAGRAFYFEGIGRAGASRAEAVKASQSLHAALLAVVIVGEALSVAHLSAIALIVVGLVLLATEEAEDPLTGEGIGLRALAYPLAGAVFFGLEPSLAKLGFAEGTPVLVGLSVKIVAATAGFLLYLAWQGALPSRRETRADLGWFVAAGVANTVFLLGLYSGLAVAPVNVVIPIVQTSPLLVVVGSAFLLGRYERITPRLVAAAVVVVAGAVGVTLLG